LPLDPEVKAILQSSERHRSC